MEGEAAAAAAEQALPVAEDVEPERAGLLCYSYFHEYT